MTKEPIVSCESLTQTYRDNEGTEVTALVGVDLNVSAGEAVALVGPSGSGKSTLLMLLAGLVKPTSGRVRVAGQDVTSMSERALLKLRATNVGMVLQTPGRNVLAYASAAENVGFAQQSKGVGRTARREEVAELLDAVGLTAATHRPARMLSGGQQQRLALAVALTGGPAVLLADEPTSQLDRASGDAILDLLLAAREQRGTTLVVVTHDHHVSNALDVEYAIHDGRLSAGAWLDRHGTTQEIR